MSCENLKIKRTDVYSFYSILFIPKPTRPTITPTFESPYQIQLPPFIPSLPGPSSNTRPPSRRMKGRQKYVAFPNIGNAGNSVPRGNVTGHPLPSVLGSPAASKGDQTTCSDAATFLSAADKARIFSINKWY